MPIIPTIHLNGSSKNDLLDKLRTAIRLIDAAIDGVRRTAPNGRDYYPKGNAAFQEARDAFHLMLGKLGEVRVELYDIALGIVNQGRDPGAGGEGFEPAPAASMSAHIMGMQEALDIIRSRPRIELPTDDPEVVTITWPSNLEAAIYVEARIAELSEGGASIWRPMADAPTDGTPFLAKFRDDWTIPVDGEPQLCRWAGRRIVAWEKNGEVRLDAPTDPRWWFELGDFEGWAPLP